ncbi:disease resistance family protein / LRR family protein [Euphorbia peplus]|nr:disease resistance family protein / LRR family protein [Euphorbia peplus]
MAKKRLYFQIFVTLFVSFKPVHLESNKLSATNPTNSTQNCIEIERKTLLNFKRNLDDSSGQLSDWIDQDCCKWSGVFCNTNTGHVIKLQLSNLNGKKISSLIDLKHLNNLSLSSNDFQGASIPKFIASFSELNHLDLSNSSFSGLIPPHLGNLSNLRYLNLEENDYIWVSDLNWITRFSHLQYLNLGDVDLSLVSNTWLHSVNMISSLEQLHFPRSYLQNFPDYIPNASNFSNLKILNFENNVLNTSIPQWLFNISSLEELDFLNCEFKGSLHDDGWGKLCNLRVLDLPYNNELGGRFDGFLGSLSKCSNSSLEELYLWDNQVNGEIPELISQFKNLKLLWFGENLVSGSIPSSIGNLSFLESFDIPSNAMDGTIPDSIGQLSNLVLLDVSRNSWKGVLSETHFRKLTKLETFGVSSLRKSLSVNISQNWIPPFSLDYLEISACNFGSMFPSWLETQTNISFLILKENGLSGGIPDWLWKVSPGLRALDLSSNQFKGEIPSSLVFGLRAWVDLHSNNLEGSLPIWTSVKDLNLDDNMFSGPISRNFCREMSLSRTMLLSGNLLNGSIPQCISGLRVLMSLDLSKNNFSGNLQIPWEEMSLRVVDLSNNNLSGEIPSSICSSPNLQVLKLFRNHLSGGISRPLENCTGLSILDLGENMFSGNIPELIADTLPDLEALGLRGNLFTGRIPEQLCRLSSLHILDLANNNFSGFIPSCVRNLSGFQSQSIYFPASIYSLVLYEEKMELIMKGREVEQIRILGIVNVIDLSSNDFRGEIPEEITNLMYLGSLNLSWNHLTGKIPEKIRNLNQLETLDLSRNKISGTIPESMVSMTLLNYLNLSNNNLSGPIPSANQFRTFNDPSIYEGNPNLCGSPLTTKCSASNNNDFPRANDDDEGEDNDDWTEMKWFYIGMAPGFVVGFWVVFGTLVIKKSWRYAYFRFLDNLQDIIYGCFT